MSSECRVVSRKAEGGGSRGRVEETRCSELRRLSGRDARRVRIRLRGRTQARPLANKSRRRDWRSDRPAFRMLLLAVVPCSGRGPWTLSVRGASFPLSGLGLYGTLSIHMLLWRDAIALVDCSVAELLTHEYLNVICVAHLTPPRCNQHSISPPTAYCPRAPLPAHPNLTTTATRRKSSPKGRV